MIGRKLISLWRRRPALAAALVGVACLLVAVDLALRPAPPSAAPPTPEGLAPLQEIEGVRSSIAGPNGPILQVHADDIRVRHAQLLGPLRLGFLHSIEARGVSVDTFDERSTQSPGASTSDLVTRAVNSLLPASLRKGVVRADIERLRFTRHEAGDPVFTLVAHRCATTTERNRVVCWNGSVADRGATTRFREAIFTDAGHCAVDGAPLVMSAR